MLPPVHHNARAEQRIDKPHPDRHVLRAPPRVCVRVRWRHPPLRPTPHAATSAPRELHARTGTHAAPSHGRMVALAREPHPAPLRYQSLDNTHSATSARRHLCRAHHHRVVSSARHLTTSPPGQAQVTWAQHRVPLMRSWLYPMLADATARRPTSACSARVSSHSGMPSATKREHRATEPFHPLSSRVQL
jgi:hypothetical protein